MKTTIAVTFFGGPVGLVVGGFADAHLSHMPKISHETAPSPNGITIHSC